MILSISPLSRPISMSNFLCLILVLFVSFLGLRFLPHLRASICLKKSIFRIFLIVLLLLIIGLLRLPWNLMFIFKSLMVSLLRIPLIIIILLGVLFILVLLVLISPMLCIS